MKKLSWAIVATLFIAACSNSADSEKANPIDADSINASEKNAVDDNRSSVIYDSTLKDGDTSSYERMPNKTTDTIPH